MAKAQQALSANLAALSYALDQAGMAEQAPLEIRINSGTRPGVRERRRQTPESAPASDMSLEFEPGKPLKNFGRLLAHEAGIPLPYNMRQSAEAAEAARIDYQNQNDTFGAMGDTFLAQMEENALAAADGAETRIYNQYAEQGRNAISAFFQQDASAEQRAAAYAALTNLDNEARLVRNSDSNERSKFARTFLAQELATSRAGLVNLDMAEKDRVFSTEAELARLDNVPRGSPEEQLVLREILGNSSARTQSTMSSAFGALGTAAGVMSANPYVAGAGALATAAGQILSNLDTKLDRDTIVKLVLEQNDALDAMTEQFRPEIVRLHEGVVEDAKSYGIPAQSWSATPIELERRYTDAWRSKLFSQGGSGTPDAPAAIDAPAVPVAAEQARANAALAVVPERFRRPTR